jgi:tetratricopeptide (TPR) repeat protein
MSQVSMTARNRRLNNSRLVILGVLVLGAATGFLVLRQIRVRDNRAMLLREAKARLDRMQVDLALSYLNRYLELNPGDTDALDLKAKVLSLGVKDAYQVLEAIQVHNQVLARDPEGPGRQDTRRRLVELTLKVGGRSQTAVALAHDLIERGADNAGAHRLLALGLEHLGEEGDAKALAEACKEYETARRKEPDDVAGAERLALLYRDKLNDPRKALRVLDDLVAASRNAPERLAQAHLVRSRLFAGLGRREQAAAEIALALKADPSSFAVRLAAAEDATESGDTTAARRYLDGIPPEARGLGVKLVESLIELKEQRPDETVRDWRPGLLQADGDSANLTWRLAHVLIDSGRVREAEPLLSQHRRLIGGDEPDAWYRYLDAFLLLKKNRTDEAIAELEIIRDKAPKPLAPHLYYLLGRCFEASQDRVKAIDAYHRAATASPRWCDPWLAISRLQVVDNPDEAAATTEQGLVTMPDDPRLLANLALLAWLRQMRQPPARRRWDEVEKALARARRASPDSVEVALVEADYLVGLGRIDDGLARLEAASKLNPRSVPLWSAWANGLTRLGRTAQALEVLDRATATTGDRAAYALIRSNILLARDHLKDARATLTEALDRVPEGQRPMLWKALGELAAGQNDPAAARQAFTEWARLQPDSPGPRASLFELALASGDEAAVQAEVEALKSVGGPKAPYWRIARVEQILRARPGPQDDAPRGAGRLDEAGRLIRELQEDHPELSAAYLLEGRLAERRHRADRAIAAYERASSLKGRRTALGPLMELLVRERRDADLDRLREAVASTPVDAARLATIEALKAGDARRAGLLAAQMAQGDPRGLDARAWQARVLGTLGKPGEAEKVLRLLKAREAAATVAQIRRKVMTDRPGLLWAQCYRAIGDAEQADACYKQALRRWPEDLAVSRSAIDFYERAGRREDAEAVLRQVLGRDPALGWAGRKLALSLSRHVNDRAAWQEALRLIGSTARPDDLPDDRLARAQVYARGPEPGHRQQAILILEELASEAPGATAVHELLARLRLASGQVDRARQHAARAAGEGASPDAILLYASILLGARDLDGAERQLDRLVAIDPDGLPVAEMRARILTARGRGEEGAAVLEKAFASRVNTPEGLEVGEKMFLLLTELKQPDAAERVARQLGALGPRGACILAEYLAGRGRLDDAAGQLQDAARAGDLRHAGRSALALAFLPDSDPRWLKLADQYLAEALKQQPGSAELLQEQAYVRRLQSRPEDQVKIYEAILARKPAGFMFLNEMAWTLSEDLHRPEEALRRADEALEHVGREPDLLDTRGVILTRLGKLDEAIKDLESAASAMPSGPVYYHLAKAYRKQGRGDEFRKARDRAKRAGLRPEQLQPSERGEWDDIMTQ